MDDVPLHDLVRPGLPTFSSEAPKNCFSLRPQSTTQEDDADVARLMARVKLLSGIDLTIVDVMVIAINPRIQPLRQCQHLLCMYKGTNNATQSIRKCFKDQMAFGIVLAGLYQGEAADSTKHQFMDGLFYYNPDDIVSFPWIFPSKLVHYCLA